MVEEPNHHKPPCRKFCNRRRKFATGVAFLWLRSWSPDKAPDRPSDERKRDEKKCGCGFRIRTKEPVWIRTGNPGGTGTEIRGGGGGGRVRRSAPPTLVPPAWGVPAWRGWAPSGARALHYHMVPPTLAVTRRARTSHVALALPGTKLPLPTASQGTVAPQLEGGLATAPKGGLNAARGARASQSWSASPSPATYALKQSWARVVLLVHFQRPAPSLRLRCLFYHTPALGSKPRP